MVWKQLNFPFPVRKSSQESYFCDPKYFEELHFGKLAQLVQSIALTGRGSLVRVQYFPHFIKSLPMKHEVGFFALR